MLQKHFIPPVENPSDDTIRANIKQFFTVQEREIMQKMLDQGKIDFVGAALDVENPERAYWLDKYLALKRPHYESEDSQVQEEIRQYETNGNSIDSPEKAAFWQHRLDLEKAGKPLPKLEDALKALEETGTKDELTEKIVEIKEEKPKRGRKKKIVEVVEIKEEKIAEEV